MSFAWFILISVELISQWVNALHFAETKISTINLIVKCIIAHEIVHSLTDIEEDNSKANLGANATQWFLNVPKFW